MAKGIYISDSIHGLTQLSEYEKRIIASVGFNRLHDVYQNSTVYLTYPSNRTKRFEHSIGTMGLCSKMFYNSITNSTSNTLARFYELYTEELKMILRSLGTEYEAIFERSPRKIPELLWDNFQLSLIPKNVPQQFIPVHMILIQAVRAAALLHDIGHPPYSHVVERAMKRAYEKRKRELGKESYSKYVEVMQQYIGEKQKLHEVMGTEISRSILKGLLLQTKEANGDPQQLAFETLVLESVLRIFGENSKFSCLHRIIDNSLDGDRLDYVTRDPANSGMNVGSIDYNRIIMDMRIVIEDDTNEPLFCVPLKAMNAVEDFLKRRYDMYKNIIFHHRVIKTDYLMEYAVVDLINEYLKETDQDSEDSEENETIPFDISGLWAPLGLRSLSERDCILSQWNDSWLMTVLKKIYYEHYYNVLDANDSRYVVSKQFAELLTNERNYVTLIKRSEDFKYIDDNVKQMLSESEKTLQDKITALKRQSEQYSKNKEKNEDRVDIAESLNQIEEIMRLVQKSSNKDNEFIMARLFHRKQAFLLGNTENLEENIQEIVRNVCRQKLESHNVLDDIVVFKEISTGDEPGKTIYFYDNTEKLYTLDEASGVMKALRTENLFRPVFYLYLLADQPGDRKLIMDKKVCLLSEIGNRVGALIVDEISKNLDDLLSQLN